MLNEEIFFIMYDCRFMWLFKQAKRKNNSRRSTAMMNEEAIILDVREADEYESGHIPNAIQLSVNELEAKAIEVLSDKQQVILIYCRSGNRSAQASKILNKLNYEQVYDFGGINDWPYEIEKN